MNSKVHKSPYSDASVSSAADSCAETCPKIQELENEYHSLMSKFSHELRNPLTLLNSSLQLLEHDCPSVLNSSLWPQIRGDIKDIIRLLQDMSSLNKSKEARLQVLKVFPFLEKTASSFRPIMLEKDISFFVDIDPSLRHCSLPADEMKMREALTNILVNAIEALDADQQHYGSVSMSRIRSRIMFTADLDDHLMRIHIRDNGPGIPEEYQKTLFDPFVTHKTGGTGLGMSIVKNVIELHHGTITLDTVSDTRSNTFTDFCILIPVHL